LEKELKLLPPGVIF